MLGKSRAIIRKVVK